MFLSLPDRLGGLLSLRRPPQTQRVAVVGRRCRASAMLGPYLFSLRPPPLSRLPLWRPRLKVVESADVWRASARTRSSLLAHEQTCGPRRSAPLCPVRAQGLHSLRPVAATAAAVGGGVGASGYGARCGRPSGLLVRADRSASLPLRPASSATPHGVVELAVDLPSDISVAPHQLGLPGSFRMFHPTARAGPDGLASGRSVDLLAVPARQRF